MERQAPLSDEENGMNSGYFTRVKEIDCRRVSPVFVLKLVGRLALLGMGILFTASHTSTSVYASPSSKKQQQKDFLIVDSISLYYLQDVGRVVRVLSGKEPTAIGNNGAENAKSENATIELDKAFATKLEAQRKLTEARNRMAEKKTELIAELEAINTLKAGNAQDEEKYESDSRKLEDVNKKLAASPNDELLKIQKVALEKSLSDGKDKKETSKKKYDTSLAEHTAKKNALEAAIVVAETALTAAAENFSKSQAEMANKALMDNTAFAQLRAKGEPYYEALRNENSINATQRVTIYGFQDSRSLFLYGTPEDILMVKRQIAQLDRPQGQAYITIYSMELTDEGNIFGNDRIRETYKQVKGQLNDIREKTDRATNALRQALYETMEDAESTYNKMMVARIVPESMEVPVTVRDKNRKVIETVVQNRIKGVKAGVEVEGTLQILSKRPVWVYADDVLGRFLSAGTLAAASPEEIDFVSSILPEPRRTTTLAESMVILSLLHPEMQGAVLRRFEELAGEGRKVGDAPSAPVVRGALAPANFEHFFNFVGKPTDDAYTSGVGMRSFRQELAYYLKRTALENATEEVENLLLSKEKGAQDPLKTRLINARLEATGLWIYSQYVKGTNEEIKAEFVAQFRQMTAAQFRDFMGVANARWDKDANYSARTAALNEMLKKYIQAFDDDIQEQYVEAGLDEMQRGLFQKSNATKRKMRFGLLQRTRVLATNRVISRVNAAASLSLAPNEQDENALQTATQLGQLAALAGSGGASSVAGGSKNPLGNLGNALNNSAKKGVAQEGTTSNANAPKPEETKTPAPGVYAIGSTGLFSVTPVFDPTGQALRFRLDYVSRNQVKEPDGSTDPAVPRVDYHSINVDVQLSNQEIRLISEYSVNSQVGRAASTNGGLPVFKNTPVLKEIPLVGWFTKRAGVPGQVAQSLIFAQTTMYPTIGDVVGLLTRTPNTRVNVGR
jgi:hypothetical protein